MEKFASDIRPIREKDPIREKELGLSKESGAPLPQAAASRNSIADSLFVARSARRSPNLIFRLECILNRDHNRPFSFWGYHGQSI